MPGYRNYFELLYDSQTFVIWNNKWLLHLKEMVKFSLKNLNGSSGFVDDALGFYVYRMIKLSWVKRIKTVKDLMVHQNHPNVMFYTI